MSELFAIVEFVVSLPFVLPLACADGLLTRFFPSFKESL